MNDTFLITSNNHRISYRHISGEKNVGVVFMHGTLSDKNATKSIFLQELCLQENISFTAFDFLGHGQSSGEYTQGTIGIWLENALAVIDQVTSKDTPLILVGSSMGGWIMLLSALARQERVKGLVGLAAAPDFTKSLWRSFSALQKQNIQKKGVIYTPNGWTEQGDPWTYNLFQDAKKNFVLKKEMLSNISCPITLIHGQKDDCIPVSTAFKIMDKVSSQTAKVIMLKNSGHRLSEPSELLILRQAILEML